MIGQERLRIVAIEARGLIPRVPEGCPWQPSPLNLSVPCHAVVGMVGPNGNGKTTWMRLLGGGDDPAQGDLTLLGRDVWTLEEFEWQGLRQEVGFILSHTPLLSVVNGLVNVTLPALYHQMGTPAMIEERARKLIDRLGWSGDLTLLPGFMSELQRRVLALARCLILNPRVLFIDEPFVPLDNAARTQLERHLIRLVREEGLTLVASSHNLSFVRRHADIILFAHSTGLKIFGSWDQFSADPDPEIQIFLHPELPEATAGAGHFDQDRPR